MNRSRTLQRPKAGAPVGTVHVTVTAGPSRGTSTQADQALTLGSAPDNQLVIEDPTVSRYHLELSPRDDGVEVRDLGSLNGTYLGGLRIYRATVPPGSELSIGETRFQVSSTARAGVPADVVDLPSMVVSSGAMTAVASQILQVAPADVSVLLQGETGTGKEVVARAIHELSERARGPFVVVDCGSMPATLIASELFGHERGAFTGADRVHDGAFQRANGGTLFLDEIGELPLPVQPVLLGALARRHFRRVGGRDEIEVDVRVIAATHRDLRAEVNQERFRSDLYYRLAVARIVIPPLRDRVDDIEPLVRHFVTESTGRSELPFGPETIEALKRHRWSGNVRELRNVVEAALVMGEVKLDRTMPGIGEAAGETSPLLPYKEARAGVLSDFEATYLGRLISQTKGNASEAARVAKMDRQYLLRLLRKHDLR